MSQNRSCSCCGEEVLFTVGNPAEKIYIFNCSGWYWDFGGHAKMSFCPKEDAAGASVKSEAAHNG